MLNHFTVHVALFILCKKESQVKSEKMAFSQQKSTKSQGKVKKYWLFVDFCWLKAVFSGFTWLSFYRASSSMLTLPSPVKNNLRGAFKILKIHLSTRIMWFRVLNCNVISLAKLSINFKASSTQRRWKGGLACTKPIGARVLTSKEGHKELEQLCAEAHQKEQWQAKISAYKAANDNAQCNKLTLNTFFLGLWTSQSERTNLKTLLLPSLFQRVARKMTYSRGFLTTSSNTQTSRQIYTLRAFPTHSPQSELMVWITPLHQALQQFTIPLPHPPRFQHQRIGIPKHLCTSKYTW